MSENNFEEFNNVTNDVNIEELPYSEEAAGLAVREASESAQLIAEMEEEADDLHESEFEERRKKNKKVVCGELAALVGYIPGVEITTDAKTNTIELKVKAGHD